MTIPTPAAGPRDAAPAAERDSQASRAAAELAANAPPRRSLAGMLWELYAGSRARLGLVTATLALCALLTLAPAAAVKLVIDFIIPGRPLPPAFAWLPSDRLAALYLAGGLLLAAALLEIALRTACRWYVTRQAIRVQLKLKRRLFHHVVRLPLDDIQRWKSGGVAGLLRDDFPSVVDFTVELFLEMWRSALRLLGSIVVLWWVDYRLLLAMAVLVPLILWNYSHWNRQVRPIVGRLNEFRRRMDARLTEVFAGLRIVRAFGGARREARRFAVEQHEAGRMKVRITDARLHGAWWEALSTGASLALLIYGGAQVVRGELTLGDLVMFLTVIGLLIEPVIQLVRSAEEMRRHGVGLEQLFEVLALPTEHEDPEARRIAADEVRGELALRGIGFTYRGAQRPALAAIDLDIPPGEVIALVGKSGAGKTTLCNVIAGFYAPTTGTLTLDGRDVRSLHRDDYRRLFGIVEQDVFLFDGTVAENIAYGAPRASSDDIAAAARAAQLDDYIRAAPLGYETVVGERGAFLSGGQRQRLAIARCLCVRPAMVILDEATSSLDGANEAALQACLDELLAGRTCIVIAHRASTVARADRVVVLEAGRVVEIGRHAELLRQSARYRELFGELTVDRKA